MRPMAGSLSSEAAPMKKAPLVGAPRPAAGGCWTAVGAGYRERRGMARWGARELRRGGLGDRRAAALDPVGAARVVGGLIAELEAHPLVTAHVLEGLGSGDGGSRASPLGLRSAA